MRSNSKMKTFQLLMLFCSSVFCENDANENDSMVIVRGKNMWRMLLGSHNMYILRQANKDVKSLTTDFQRGLIYWNEGIEILRANINKMFVVADDAKFLVDTETNSMAFDWVYNHIYYANLGSIKVTDGKTVIHLYYKDILTQDLALDPHLGYLFWTEETDGIGRIVRGASDGSSKSPKTVVENLPKTSYGHFGITLDTSYQRVYFSEQNKIFCINYFGHGKIDIGVHLASPVWAMAIYKDLIYWSDLEGLFKANKNKNDKKGDMQQLEHKWSNGDDDFGHMQLYSMFKSDVKIRCQDVDSCLCLPAPKQAIGHQFTCRCDKSKSLCKVQPEVKELKPSDAYLLLAREQDIYKINLGDFARSITVDGAHFITGLDLHFSRKMLYWSDLTDKTIYSALFETPYKKTPILKDNSLSIHSLAIDWIYSHIYWTNLVNGSIEVANMNCSFRKVLLQDEMHTKWGIAVNPLEHWMFWSNGKDNKIEKAGLDGSNRKVILSTDVQLPSDLAVELKERRVYWTNTELRSIHSCDFEGKRVEKNLVGLEFSPYSLVTFEGSIYWTTRNEIAVFTANKSEGWKVTPSNFSGKLPASLKVFHKSKQPEGINYCQVLFKHCSHLCLPVPFKKDIVTCACPDGFQMKADGITCKMNVHSPDCTRRYVIEVWIFNSKSKNNKKYCSGTVISDRWVRTVASCVINSGGARFIKVNPNLGSKAFEKFWDVIKVVMHPKFEESEDGSYKHNVALLKISQRITGITGITYCDDEEMPQIGLYSDVIHTNKFIKFNVDGYKDFALNHTINKHRRFIIARPFRKSPQKSHLVPFKVRNKPEI